MHENEESRPVVLVIDDSPQNLLLIDELLSGEYRVKVAANGNRGLTIARQTPAPDLILLDVRMPDPDGFEVCRQLKADHATGDIPIIFLTALNDPADEAQGLVLGAVDYITKPVSPPILSARVRNHLRLKEVANFLRDRNAFLEAEVQRRTEESRRRAEEARVAQETIMISLASIAEARDNETGNHILRTQHYVRALAEQLRTHPRFAAQLNDEMIDLLFKAAPLHDIGKVGIPDRILMKPGRLTDEEMTIMKTHTTIGHDAIERTMMRVGERVPVLEVAKEIALSHQEKWDGSGYPLGLAGDAIPLSGRLMAVADVYDALISRRVYKDPIPVPETIEIMIRGRDSHFDPDILDAFLDLRGRFLEIQERFIDLPDELDKLEANRHICISPDPSGSR
ncbi:response regulator [Zoogloea dura]|uniref:Two-component system response regulator n=1 Tax=Zoogloea dura TaxID=2728840 RepID=A0A848FZB7_9RHOO|nr:two-component system response regulator [Zoogloea dura]NML24372.1 two-component system response regulator [Zoogloea dura]